MRTVRSNNLASAIFSNTLQRVLGVLFTQPERIVHLRGIVKETGQSPGTVQRILDRLDKAGIVIRERQGQQVMYRANPQCPIYSELVGIAVKTVGLAEPISQSLQPISGHIRIAFIFGSIARREDKAQSDIDLFVLGDISMTDVAPLLANIQEKLGREINPVVYTHSDFVRQLRQGSHFLNSIIDEPKIYMIGSEDEFRRLVE
jgi:predicted nucleotidyltransferase